ncbi:MAG TPA: ABC transporter ATP-binding protein [Anaerolineales bacterium]|nr:ABC transporter ATP-binding protein [Anaerolineales bacterium]
MQLIVNSLGKQYKSDFWGLKDFSLDIRPGILGLLGPNGAGKSTFMRMLATITKPTTGTICWNDTDVVKSPDVLREVLGYLPQDFGVYPNLNAVEFLEYMAAIKGLNAVSSKRRIDELLQVTNLVEAAKRPLGGYSGGMKQRVGIAQALLNDPQLLIVDEPTVGLDPEERVRFRNLLSDLSRERIVILSTHIVSDVESTATQIALVNKGQLLRTAAPEDLLKELENKVWEWIVRSEDLPTLKQKHIISGTIRRSDGVQVRVVSADKPDSDSHNISPNLEDAYLFFIGGKK